MTSISGISNLATTTMASSALSTATALSSSSTTATAPSSTDIDKDTFLKLLVAQMKYQDPSKPADRSQFLSQTAQFTLVEKIAALTALDQKVLDSARAQTAASLVGRSVTWTNASGASQTGTVTAASMGASTPSLTVDGFTVSLDAVTSVGGTTPSKA